jgi:hypothetical protein
MGGYLVTDAILKFQDENGNHTFLSNFYPSPITLVHKSMDGSSHDSTVVFPTVEHFFQAQKMLSSSYESAVAAAATPGRAKQLGRSATLRSDWETVKLKVMRYALDVKFPALNDKSSKNIQLSKLLLATGDAYLEEGNSWGDSYWGKSGGFGENWLGVLLMARRTALRYYARKAGIDGY